MNPADVLTALHLPVTALADQRIPKKLLLENGTPTSADKRLIETHVAELRWDAVLRPDTVAIPAYQTDVHEYPELQAMTVTVRDLKLGSAKATRLRELIHRAIPYPLLLLETDGPASSGTTWFSLAPKRRSQAEHEAVVLESEVISTPVTTGPFLADFLNELALERRPFAHLREVYSHWETALLALLAADITGQYHLSTQPELLWQHLSDYQRLAREIASLRATATREKALARRAELNVKVQTLIKEQAQVKANLLS